jgi:hypothetical protein
MRHVIRGKNESKAGWYAVTTPPSSEEDPSDAILKHLVFPRRQFSHGPTSWTTPHIIRSTPRACRAHLNVPTF